MDPEFWVWLTRALGGGFLSFLAQRCLKRAAKKLEELQSQPLKTTDQDLEEILGHFIEEMGDLEDPTVQDSLRVIRKQMGVSRAYLLIWVERLGSEENKPGGA
ncbi:MAG: hypothetical protein AAF728_03560 [Cyanobacteria bacterium P01_D01_bin.128]